MIKVLRVDGGIVPVLRKAVSLPKPALLRRMLQQGWILPDVQGPEIEQWLAVQLSVARRSGRALSSSATKALVDSISQFMKSRNVRNIGRQKIETAVLRVAGGAITPDMAVRQLWGIGAGENAVWREATDQLTNTLSRTWAKSATEYVHALAASKTMKKWIEETRGGNLSVLTVEFGRPNPRQIPAFKREALRLVEGLDETARRGVQRVITRGLQSGQGPLDVARDVWNLPRFALTEQQAVAVQNYRRELEEGQWGKARSRGLHDQRFRVEPVDEDAIDALVDRYGERLSMYRARTIARTEMMRAVNRGNQAVWEELADQGVVRMDGLLRFWVTAPENASGAGLAWNAPSVAGPCEICGPIPAANAEGRAMDEPFDYEGGQIDMPPVHPNCRCLVFYQPKFLSLKERVELARAEEEG